MFKICLFIAVFALNIFAQGNVNDLLTSVQEKYKSIEDFSAEFEKSSNGKTDLTGKVFYKKDNKVRLELKNLTIVSDGKTNWNYNKNNNKVIISEYDEFDPLALSLDKILMDYPEKCKVSMDGDNILVLTPENKSELRFDNIKLWINKDNLITRARINSQNRTTEIDIKNYNINKNLADSQFTLTPPEGSEVIDLR